MHKVIFFLKNVTLFMSALKDPDDTADDGTYAAVILRSCIKQKGRLTAKVFARAEGGKSSVKTGCNAGAEFPDSGSFFICVIAVF